VRGTVEEGKEEKQLQKAANVLNEIMQTPDRGISSDLLAKSVWVGVVPSEIKGALGVGGTYGVPVCRKDGNGSWGAPSAAAGPVGRTAEGATDAQMHAEILSYSRTRGLFEYRSRVRL
jgi:SH3 domain-containing YSC84-like protein 1